jgi:putative phosphoesterase
MEVPVEIYHLTFFTKAAKRMKRIGLLSDTHGRWDEKLANFFANCHELWHAGDIGNMATADTINDFKPLRAVYGNIDDSLVRTTYPEFLQFTCEGVKVLMTHIGGYPKRYEKKVITMLKSQKPNLFISGHSHILKVMYDKDYDLLHINPGAAGVSGFHVVRTAVRFTVDGDKMKDLEILEIPRS